MQALAQTARTLKALQALDYPYMPFPTPQTFQKDPSASSSASKASFNPKSKTIRSV